MSAYDSSTAQLPSEGQLSWAMYGAEDTMRAFSTVGLLSCGFFKIQRRTEATPRYETNTADTGARHPNRSRRSVCLPTHIKPNALKENGVIRSSDGRSMQLLICRVDYFAKISG